MTSSEPPPPSRDIGVDPEAPPLRPPAASGGFSMTGPWRCTHKHNGQYKTRNYMTHLDLKSIAFAPRNWFRVSAVRVLGEPIGRNTSRSARASSTLHTSSPNPSPAYAHPPPSTASLIALLVPAPHLRDAMPLLHSFPAGAARARDPALLAVLQPPTDSKETFSSPTCPLPNRPRPK